MTKKVPGLLSILVVSAAMTIGASPLPAEYTPKSATDPVAGVAADTGQAKSTSETPPPTRPFSSIATPVRDYPRVASSGGCAPRYKNGSRGSCITAKPCRGYGIRNDSNEVLCMCYLTHGGCDAKSRCDDRAHACVSDTVQKNREE